MPRPEGEPVIGLRRRDWAKRRYGDYVPGAAPAPPPPPPVPDPVRDAVASGAVVFETHEDGEGVRFLDRAGVPRISAGSDALDLAYAKVRKWHVTDETNELGVVIDDSGELVQATIGSSPGNPPESFEMKMYVYGGGVRQWAAERLGVTRWDRITPTAEIGT